MFQTCCYGSYCDSVWAATDFQEQEMETSNPCLTIEKHKLAIDELLFSKFSVKQHVYGLQKLR